MRYFWDLFRWRFVAIYHIAWWFLIGAPLEGRNFPTRWLNVKWAWRLHRQAIMFPHEKHRYISLEEFLKRCSKGDSE